MRTSIAIALLLAALALVACGDDGEDDTGPTATSIVATATEVPPAPEGATNFTVVAGATDASIDIEQFMPATIRIREGDSITWTSNGYEGHTVTFFPDGKLNIAQNEYLIPAADEGGALEFNPVYALASEAQGEYDSTTFVNSGFFGIDVIDDRDYTLTFPTSGTYPYLCMIHPLHMRGTIVVEESDTPVPAPEAVAAEGARRLERYTQIANDAAASVTEERRVASQTAAGRVWDVSAGIDTPQAQVLSFVPQSLDIGVGDKVVFWNSDRDFHNVFFAPEGESPPPFPIIKPGEQGGFRLIIDPASQNEVAPPAGFGPEAAFGSGLMGIGFPRLYYEVVFTKPGTYRYYCTVHVLAGMSGLIEVR
jgi:plastocyanin